MASHKMESKTSCVNEIKIKLKDDIIKTIEFVGGCDVVYAALSNLITGKNVNEVLELLKPIRYVKCVNNESCIAQLVDLLEYSIQKELEEVEKDRQFRLTPEGLSSNIKTLLSKTKLDITKDAICIKVRKHLYKLIEENLNQIKDEIECEVYLEMFDEFDGDYIFSTVGRRNIIDSEE